MYNSRGLLLVQQTLGASKQGYKACSLAPKTAVFGAQRDRLRDLPFFKRFQKQNQIVSIV